jgi:tRNA 2-thiouridine synthesizing protein E
MYDLQEGGITERGFLSDPSRWDQEVARTLAEGEGVDLTDAHWRVLKAVRNFFDENGIPPSYHVLRFDVAKASEPFYFNCVLTIEHLFPRGGIKQACRIAGLPDYFRFGC